MYDADKGSKGERRLKSVWPDTFLSHCANADRHFPDCSVLRFVEHALRVLLVFETEPARMGT